LFRGAIKIIDISIDAIHSVVEIMYVRLVRMVMDSSSRTDIHINVDVVRWRGTVDIREIDDDIVPIDDFGLLGIIGILSELLTELKALAGTHFADLLPLLLHVVLWC